MPIRTARITLLTLTIAATAGCVVRGPGAGESVPATPVASALAPAPTPAPTGSAPEPRLAPVVEAISFDRPGFRTFLKDGRLWVFQDGSKGLAEYLESGEPGKSVTLIGEGPNGMTLRGLEKAELRSYQSAFAHGRPGYAVFEEDGRLWVFETTSEGRAEFLASGEPARSVTLVGEGPDGKTLRSDDLATARAFMAAR